MHDSGEHDSLVEIEWFIVSGGPHDSGEHDRDYAEHVHRNCGPDHHYDIMIMRFVIANIIVVGVT